jgi:hypothetical protein
MVFATIGVVSTIAYAILYWALRPAVEPLLANGLALVVTAIGNTAASDGGGGMGGSSSSELTSWLATSCTVVDGVSTSGTLYDCAGSAIATG